MFHLIEIIELFRFLRQSQVLCFLGTCLLSFSLLACGDSGSGTETAQLSGVVQPGVFGKACVTSDIEYTITDGATNETRTKKLEVSPLSGNFRGSMGGQIRAVAQGDDLLIWGGGASLRYGDENGLQGALPFERSGSVTDLLALRSEPDRLLVSTENAVGFVRIKENGLGKLQPEELRSFPLGALALATKQQEKNESLYIVTRDGYVVTTTSENIGKNENCYDILSSSAAMVHDSTNYRPLDVAIAGDFAVVLSLRKTAPKKLSPPFAEVFAPLFQSMIDGKEGGIVRAVDMKSHGLLTVGFETLDKSDIGYDRFMPTGIVATNEELYVVGIAYDKKTIDEFVVEKCNQGELAEKILCLADAANKGELTTLKTTAGVNAIVGGLYFYRNFQDLTRPAHFEWIPLSTAYHEEEAAPLTFQVTALGSQVVLRAPNFLSTLTKGIDPITDKERWSVSNQLDAAQGLAAGIPTNVIAYQNSRGTFIAAALTSAEREDGTGMSSLMISGSDDFVKKLDTGSLRTKIEGAAPSSMLAIDLMNKQGGMLYLQTPYERHRFDIPNKPDALISHAALKGDRVAYVWSDRASGEQPKPSFHLVVTNQEHEARGELVVTREGGNGHFDGFPSITGKSSEDVLRIRNIADIELISSHLFVLFEGYEDGRWYHQVGMYEIATGRPSLVSVSDTVSSPGSIDFENGKFVRVIPTGAKYTITFMAADGFYRADMEANVAARPIFQRRYEATTFVSASCDVVEGRRCVSLEGSDVHLVDAENLSRVSQSVSISRSENSTLDRLYYARTSFVGTKLFVTTPYGASSRFSMYEVNTNGSTSLASTCSQCGFNDVASFSDVPSMLFLSSPAGGIEMYDISR